MPTNRSWVLAHRPNGMVQETDFELRESAIPEPGGGRDARSNHLLLARPGDARLDC